MSVRTLSKVWDGFPGGGSELLALLALADWSDDEGRCFPSMASIGRKTRLSEKQARRIVHNLEEAGFLRVIGGQTGGGMSRRYQIALDRLTPPADGRAPAGGRAPADVPNPSRPREGTPPTHGRRTVSEPSKNRQLIADEPPVSSKAADHCPHQQIIDLYHQTLPTGRQVRIWNDTRKAKLRARWKEDPKRQSLEWWGKFFGYVAESDFLTGKTASAGRPPFELDLEWIVSPTNFVKIIEGKYHREAAA
ncbi:helix-turn-helix domain-containing protein [Zoogloea sp. 1C4]|jgi:hypothetical protein|uniref:helix-turn-helix domain-containing protein n=1 Tax=Zoogloea sp. 1C4 TaxID=2570190 RepID=UPI001884FE72|nr:helix-turn-helix domain-containing protein [Zoogloea sp. 1C4]